MKTPHTALRIPPELKEAATAKAKEQGLNLSQWVFGAMRLYLNNETQQKATYYAKSLSKALKELKTQTP